MLNYNVNYNMYDSKTLLTEIDIIAERFRFHHRHQHEDENVSTFLAGLRKLLLHCQFDNLNDTLRDRFVCGLTIENIQKRLLSETTLSLEKTLAISVAMEMAERGLSWLLKKRPYQEDMLIRQT